MSWAIEGKSYSQRRACALIGMSPKTYRYETRRADDAALRARLKDLAAERRRFGYRRLKLLLEREGFRVNHKKLYRIYREERLVVRKRGGRKRALGTRAPMALPQEANQRWSLDFVSDALAHAHGAKHVEILSAADNRAEARVYPVDSGDPTLTRSVAEIAAHGGWQLDEIHTEEGRLDEVFRSITSVDTRSGRDQQS